jgi:hypothetical protein
MHPLARRPIALALAAALAGCGGGFIVGDGFFLSINAFVDGHFIGEPIRSGSSVTLTIAPGQTAQFDANESATWRFSVNGGAPLSAGATVVTGGLTITVRVVSASAVAVDTALVSPAALPVFVVLTATSTRDAAEVATVQLQIR